MTAFCTLSRVNDFSEETAFFIFTEDYIPHESIFHYKLLQLCILLFFESKFHDK